MKIKGILCIKRFIWGLGYIILRNIVCLFFMRNFNKFMFFAIFHRLLFISPLIILLIVFFYYSFFTNIIYWIFILSLTYLLFFTIRDAFFKEKEIQDKMIF